MGGSKKTATDTYQYPFGYIFGTSKYDQSTEAEQWYYGDDTTKPTYSTYYIPTELRSVTITGGEILYGAFSKCELIESITLHNDIASLGENAFSRCWRLTNITIPDGVTSIGNRAFFQCSNLTNLTIPDSVVSIGASAFYDCDGLTSVIIGNGVTSISERAFWDCRDLTEVTIGSSVTNIESMAFYDCNNLTTVYYKGTEAQWNAINIYQYEHMLISASKYYFCETEPTIYGNFWHYDTDGNTPVIWKNVGPTEYSYLSFRLLANDTYEIVANDISKVPSELVIPSNNGKPVSSIGSEAFSGCSWLTSVIIPDSITNIAGYAFKDCANLSSVDFGNGVTYIGLDAFQGCVGLTSITLPDSLEEIHGSFVGCSGLTDVMIPNNVTRIGGDAFAGCSGLTNIVIPDSVTFIGPDAFKDCIGLTSVTLSNNISVIEGSVFRGCSKLTNVTIPDGVTTIKGWAFANCSSLTNITIPNSVTSIGDAFYGCSKLNSIAFDGTVEQWNAIEKDYYWNSGVPATKVVCSDGTVDL